VGRRGACCQLQPVTARVVVGRKMRHSRSSRTGGVVEAAACLRAMLNDPGQDGHAAPLRQLCGSAGHRCVGTCGELARLIFGAHAPRIRRP
jgi:hypothetical protein